MGTFYKWHITLYMKSGRLIERSFVSDTCNSEEIIETLFQSVHKGTLSHLKNQEGELFCFRPEKVEAFTLQYVCQVQ